ncbi:MAG: hypothetical protein WA746_04135 [Isosphaeraceae bacterium]
MTTDGQGRPASHRVAGYLSDPRATVDGRSIRLITGHPPSAR